MEWRGHRPRGVPVANRREPANGPGPCSAIRIGEERGMSQTATLSPDARRISSFQLGEDLNFLLTNRIPRRYATLLMGQLSRVESPLLVRLAVAAWSLVAKDLR